VRLLPRQTHDHKQSCQAAGHAAALIYVKTKPVVYFGLSLVPRED